MSTLCRDSLHDLLACGDQSLLLCLNFELVILFDDIYLPAMVPYELLQLGQR
jgi:hypothetical protein